MQEGAARQRLFLALPCPLTPPIAEALDELRAAQDDPTAGLRVVAADTLHITLSFLGSIPPESIADIRAAMAELRKLPAPQLVIRGAGYFASALWLAVEGAGEDVTGTEGISGGESAGLATLAQRCEAALRAHDFELEHRPYLPHVTVARLRHGGTFDCQAWCDKHRTTAWAAFTADALHLYRSETLDGAARYSIVHSIPLG